MAASNAGAGGANPYAGILGIATAIVSTLSWQETLNEIAKRIGEVLFAWSASINSYDRERHAVVYEAYWCAGGATQEDLDYIGHVAFIEDRPDFKMLIEGRSLVESHVDDPSLPEVEREVMKEWGLKTNLDGPLVFDGEVIGTVGVAETRFVRRFTPGELDLFRQLCELAAIGIHNAQAARLRRQTEQRLATLAELGRELSVAGSPAQVEDAVLAAATTALETSSVSLAPSGAVSEAVVQRLADSGLGEDSRTAMVSAGVAVRLLVPIPGDGGQSAQLVAGWSDEHHRVSDGDLLVAGIIATQAALGLAARVQGAARP